MTGPSEIHVAWQPDRAVRSKYIPKSNPGDHTCTLACECVPDHQFAGNAKERLLQSYPPFPGMPSSNGRVRDGGWADRWQSMPLTPELVAAKQANRAKVAAMNEEYDVQPADVETVVLRI